MILLGHFLGCRKQIADYNDSSYICQSKFQQLSVPSPIPDRFSLPDRKGRFGPYGGSYVPETLFHPLKELNDAYLDAQSDPEFEFKNELNLLREFAGRH